MFAVDSRIKYSDVDVQRHVIADKNYADTPFISMTADPSIARRFGVVIGIRKDRLQGHLMNPDEIVKRSGKETSVQRYVKKNGEFLLAPSGLGAAKVPKEAIIV